MTISKVICVVCLLASPLFAQSDDHYQVAKIIGVHQHLDASDDVSGPAKYDVSVRVGKTIYEVLYKPIAGAETVKYVVGRELLVEVGDKSLIYNDLLGQSFEVPIISRRPAEDTDPPK